MAIATKNDNYEYGLIQFLVIVLYIVQVMQKELYIDICWLFYNSLTTMILNSHTEHIIREFVARYNEECRKSNMIRKGNLF